jgi:hypothetical protein
MRRKELGMKNSKQSDCGKVFAEDLNKEILAIPKDGEPCSEARARVIGDHKKNKPRSLRPDVRTPLKGEIE